jgi:hypothetical protein
MRSFHVVTFPGKWVDGKGHYNMVSEPKVSTLSLDELDKRSLDPRFREEIVSRRLILNLRMFMGANGLLSHVRSSREVAVE